jgi:glycosyltransferase involved in cell wall biosynthesis
MKLAIVHDYLNQMGGAERTVEVLHEVFPDAPIYTSIYLPDKMPDSLRQMDIRTSFMQKLPGLSKHFKKYLLLYPYAFMQFNLGEYDVVLSSSSAWAKGVAVNTKTCHICYCYTPMRFVWNYEDYVRREKFGHTTRKILPVAIERLKKWDLSTVNNVDYYVAISKYVAERIKRCYEREAEVIYPPVNTYFYKMADSSKVEDYYLIVSRLNTYKKIDLVVETFNQLGLPLVIIGDGPYGSYLQRIAGKNIKFLGRLTDEEIKGYYERCRAFIFPGEEDFGITPLEAQSAFRPVIAFGRGGALETVIDGKTGVFFDEHTIESLKDAVLRFNKIKFDPFVIRKNAESFDKSVFMSNIKLFVEVKYREHLEKISQCGV